MYSGEEVLANIKNEIKELESPIHCSNEDDFLDLSIKLANFIRGASTLIIHSIPYDRASTFESYSRLESTVVGNIVRLFKLYDALTFNLSNNFTEIAAILSRLISETGGYLNYLINSNDDTKKKYILISHKSNAFQLKELLNIKSERDLQPIEQRMYERIHRLLKEDEINEEEILNNRQWKLDGKTTEQLLQRVEYNFVFRGMSVHVHGSWHDLSIYHLSSKGDGYLPRTEFYPPDTRYLNPISIMMIRDLKTFLVWNKSDPQNILRQLLDDLLEKALEIETYHERYFNKSYIKWKEENDNT